MPKRTVVSGALSLAATVATATIALVALSAGTGTGGTSASPAPPDTVPTTAPAGAVPAALDAEALARLVFVRAATAAPAPTADSGADTVRHDVATTVATFPSGSPAPTGGSDDDDPAPVAAAPTPTTTPAGFDCSGSDDGLSEAVKHAREEYCHREDDD